MIRERNYVLDFAKIIGFIFVIMYHILMAMGDSYSKTPVENYLFLTCNTIFFVISGVFAPNTDKMANAKDLLFHYAKLFFQLIIPCVTFCFFTLIITNNFDLINYFKTFIFFPGINLWFLWVLFLINIFFSFFVFLQNKLFKTIKKNSIRKLIALLFYGVFLSIILIFLKIAKINYTFMGFNLVLLNSFYYLFGFFCKKIICLDIKRISKKGLAIYYISSGLGFLYTWICCFLFKSIYDLPDTNLLYVIMRITASTCSVFSLIAFLKLFSNFLFFKRSSKIGLYSLEIYYIHSLLLKIIDVHWLESIIPNGWIVSFSWLIILLALSGIALICILCIPFLHLLLFGKTKSYYFFESKLFSKCPLIK